MGRLKQWIDSSYDEVDKYHPDEVMAELLRQEIRQLEKESLDPDQKHKIFENAKQVALLKKQLSAVRESADQINQSRTVLKAMFDLSRHALETRELPPGSREVLERYERWIEEMEEKDKGLMRFQRHVLSQRWPHIDWSSRLKLLRWYWRGSSSRFFRGTVPRKISRQGSNLLKSLI